MRVEITAPKVVGKRKAYDTSDSPLIDITKEMLPEKFNVKSELKKDLRAGRKRAEFRAEDEIAGLPVLVDFCGPVF